MFVDKILLISQLNLLYDLFSMISYCMFVSLKVRNIILNITI